MTRDDIEKLWALLALYRPNDRHLQDEKLKSLWLLTLEPYAPADVKAAVAGYFREKKFWPDVTDIAVGCPPPPEPPRTAVPKGKPDLIMEGLRGLWEKILPRRKAAGLPATWSEAQAEGLTYRRWWELLEAHGVGFPDHMEDLI